ncbi:hypothetical protein KG088_09985 [Halomonas sp. TRM85114]|uniref:hypothetical protein n=1 Tax=Halomonas jincaotanensis TaxID=2810616 RepID=UPI001BD3A9D7|nr:hypothetical protein [Halomonas jincaotanensis]MBS9403959.1 hypothetical protein [Halomonas jincaotanensis]
MLMILGLMLVLGTGLRLLEQRTDDPLYRVIVNGQPLTLDAENHAALSRDIQAMTGDIEARLMARMTPWLEERLDQAFAPLTLAVPDYLDWYYSPGGSYMRLGVALVGDADAWLDEQLHQRLVRPSGIEAALAELQVDYPQRLAREQQGLATELTSTLHERYVSRQVAAEGESEQPVHEFDLDGVLQHALQDGLDTARWSTAAAGGSGAGLLAGRTLARRLGASAAVQGSRMALRSLVVRLGTGTARALATGGATAAATAPTGPGALVAGTLTTAVTLASIAGSEYALLKMQAAIHRPTMQTQLLEAIGEAREASLFFSLETAVSAAAVSQAEQLETQAARRGEGEPAPNAYRILGRLNE